MDKLSSEGTEAVLCALQSEIEVFTIDTKLVSDKIRCERGTDAMGLNRQMRRQQTREKMQEWVRDGTAEKVRKLSVNGITDKDLDEYYKKGYEEGYMYASTAFMKKMYAAIAKELTEAGNSREDVYCFVRNVDQRFAVMFDADDEIEDVFEQIGVRMVLKTDGISTIEVK